MKNYDFDLEGNSHEIGIDLSREFIRRNMVEALAANDPNGCWEDLDCIHENGCIVSFQQCLEEYENQEMDEPFWDHIDWLRKLIKPYLPIKNKQND